MNDPLCKKAIMRPSLLSTSDECSNFYCLPSKIVFFQGEASLFTLIQKKQSHTASSQFLEPVCPSCFHALRLTDSIKNLTGQGMSTATQIAKLITWACYLCITRLAFVSPRQRLLRSFCNSALMNLTQNMPSRLATGPDLCCSLAKNMDAYIILGSTYYMVRYCT